MEYDPPIEPGHDRLSYDKVCRTIVSSRSSDPVLLDRALGILHRMATENTGLMALFHRWYYADEPLRNDAANLVREAQFGMMKPANTRLVGDDLDQSASGLAGNK